MSEYEAGRQLDAMIAERVMGWTVNRPGDRHWHTLGGGLGGRQVGSNCCEDRYDYARAFMPSQDIRSAWEVVATFEAGRVVGDKPGWPDAHGWYVGLNRSPRGWEAHIGTATAEADTAPLAICRCALKAIESQPTSESVTDPIRGESPESR